jgi:hypothetical protein
MSNLVLLVVLAVCALAVIGALAYLGLRAYRLVRTGMRVSHETGERAKQLTDRTAAAQAKAAVLAETGGKLGENATGLQSALARLMVLTSAISEARTPWQSVARLLRK